MIQRDDEGNTVLDRRSNAPIITETRAPQPFRALPRPVRDHIIGHPEKGIVGLDTSKAFLVRYQEFAGPYVSRIRCWKCGTAIVSWAPALRLPDGSTNPNDAETTKVTVSGKEMILGSLLPLNHYREGLFAYRATNGSLNAFSYLHCADCSIVSGDGDSLFACLLGGFDLHRDAFQHLMALPSDDAWAQSMYRWNGIELIGTQGPSLSPKDMMDAATNRGRS